MYENIANDKQNLLIFTLVFSAERHISWCVIILEADGRSGGDGDIRERIK